MNWDALGAIGEMIGAVLVAGTLIYLVIQVRQNSAGINATITQANIAAFNDLNALLATDPKLAEIFERGSDDPSSLNDAENRSFTWLMRSYLNLYLNLFDQFQQGTCPEALWERHALELAVIAPSPGIQAFRRVDTSFEGLFAYIAASDLAQLANQRKLELRV